MKRIKIIDVFKQPTPGEPVFVQGWVRTRRTSKQLAFIELNDGSCLKNLQVVVDNAAPFFSEVDSIGPGAAIGVSGTVAQSPGQGQNVELQASAITIYGTADNYPLQKKKHSLEFLRTIAHLRNRTNTFGSVFRLRNVLARAIHRFFQERGFLWIHPPIITASDCEGAGELFKVTTLDLSHIPRKKEDGTVDYSTDFFGKPTYLTVSGQLEAELLAMGLSEVYTFGPTFRAENSNTRRHLSEFWMVEPEMAFYDLNDNIALAEAFLKAIILECLETLPDEIDFFEKHYQPGLRQALEQVTRARFERIPYTEAVKILEQSGESFEFPVKWGLGLQAEHEKFLTEKKVGGPIIVTDYPKEITAFYMRLNEDDRTVRAMDVLCPGIGEIIGGSQREERLDVLKHNITNRGMSEDTLWWYLDLRKFGTVYHSGFGLGFERMLQYISGIENIRDVIPFPRSPGNADF